MVFVVPVPSHSAASSALATSVTSRVRSTASRPTTEVRISSLLSFTNTFSPFNVRGQQGYFVERHVPVADLGAFGDESRGDAIDDPRHPDRTGRVEDDGAGQRHSRRAVPAGSDHAARADQTGTATATGFNTVDEIANPLGVVPVVNLRNTDRILGDTGGSEIDDLKPVVDAFNKSLGRHDGDLANTLAGRAVGLPASN